MEVVGLERSARVPCWRRCSTSCLPSPVGRPPTWSLPGRPYVQMWA